VDVEDLSPAVVTAYLSDEELPDVVDGVEVDHDLAWFATQEIRTLL
jgi:hypothetical protein